MRRAANSSFDAEDDLDSDLAEELSRFRSPDTWNKVAQHLDLVWKIGRVRYTSAHPAFALGVRAREDSTGVHPT